LNHKDIKDIANLLLIWMERENFCGWDPHDGLNSPFLKGIPSISRWAGVAAIQVIKRIPLNLRPFLLVPKTLNAKGLGLILAASICRYRMWQENSDLDRAVWIGKWLDEHRAIGYSGVSWGYPFDWPNRSFYLPKGTPTVVNTTFVAHALLDLYEQTKEERWLSLSESACDFICNDLQRSQDTTGICFSYTPLDGSRVHNANLLAASILSRVGKITGRSDLCDLSAESVTFSVNRQKPDGSWPYGEAQNQSWVDSFHTGYNLVALKKISEVIGDSSLQKALDNGYRYYLDHFFLPDGTVKYYHNKIEPLDAHAFAHAVICLAELDNHTNTKSGLVQKVMERMIQLFWSGEGYFYWQRYNGFLYRMPCMRWVQAWVLLSLTKYLLNNLQD
jgi:hypothetical protein